jgi:hypothetical protein
MKMVPLSQCSKCSRPGWGYGLGTSRKSGLYLLFTYYSYYKSFFETPTTSRQATLVRVLHLEWVQRLTGKIAMSEPKNAVETGGGFIRTYEAVALGLTGLGW